LNDREVSEEKVAPIRDAILHALQLVPSAADLSESEAGGRGEKGTILATCIDGTEIAIEISVL
jgi:hypothetical protein